LTGKKLVAFTLNANKKKQMQHNQQKIKRASGIVASVTVSLSEILRVQPYFTLKSTRNSKGEYSSEFLELLYGLGADVQESIREDLSSTHRNRFNEVVTCPKWLCEERLDSLWINSGYASRAAVDKASGSLLVEASYRMRGETKDMQAMLNQRDKSCTIDESTWIKE
jgi:hypothetical protein